MPSFVTFRPASVRRWIWLPVAFGLVVAAALFGGAGPARADVLPTLTAFHASASSVDVTTGDAHISVTMSVSDPDATGVGTGDIIAHGPTRGYNPSGHLVQVGGTATNTQYRADITLPAGKAVGYRMDITFEEERYRMVPGAYARHLPVRREAERGLGGRRERRLGGRLQTNDRVRAH